MSIQSLRQQLDRRPDGATRFLALSGLMGGRWFSLHDVDQRSGRIRRVALESQNATHRIFLQADRGRWIYAFAEGEPRALDIGSLERQLAASRYIAEQSAAAAR